MAMKINLLIVDDIADNLYTLEVLLEELEIKEENFDGLNIIRALSGKEALRIVLKEHIDLILLDIRMPEMDGFQVAEILQSTIKTSQIPIIFLTAEFRSEEFVKRGYKIGALDYFIKPIEEFQFLNKIKMYITLFLSKKVQKKEFDDTLLGYMNLIDRYIITVDIDISGKITRASDAFYNISGYTKEDLTGRPYRSIIHDMDNEIYEGIWHELEHDGRWHGQIKNKTKDDKYFWVNAIISPIYSNSGEKNGYTLIKQDITDKKMLEKIAITDALTNLYNRRYFNEVMPKIINIAKRYGNFISFAMMDIDFFKGYNDTYGHQAGDEVLKKVAAVLTSSAARGDDYCFRIGGEEFAVAFGGESGEKAVGFMTRIKEKIEALKIENRASTVSRYVTVSIGLNCRNGQQIEDINELYQDTDRLLYQAKESGKNKVVCNL